MQTSLERKIEQIREKKRRTLLAQQQNEQMNALKQELEKINKNNQTLALIQQQYVKELERRKQAVVESNQCHSPPRRTHTYTLGVGGSPSPKKRTITFDENGKKVESPMKEPALKISDMHSGAGKGLLLNAKHETKQSVLVTPKKDKKQK